MRRIQALVVLIGLLGGDAADASAVRPCREPLEGARRLGDEKWIAACTARATMPAPVLQCREWLAACRRNPQHPLPPGTNSL